MASDISVQDLYAQDYGGDAKKWISAVEKNHQNVSKIGALYQTLEAASTLDTYLGDLHSSMDILQGSPFMDVNPVSVATHEVEINAMRFCLGPFKAVPVAAPAAGPHGGGIDAVAFATAIASKEDRKENDKLQSGYNKTCSFFIGGVIKSKKSGELTSVDLPDPTAGFIDCNLATTKPERKDILQRMANSNNVNHPAGSIHATFRDMRNHDDNLILAMVDGLYAKEPLNDITAKIVQVHIVSFLPLLKDFSDQLVGEQQRRDMEDSVDAAATDRAGKRTYIFVNSSNMGYEQLKSMLANFTALGQCMFLVNIPDKKPIVIIYVEEVLDLLIDVNTKHWYATDNDDTERIQFQSFVVNRLDKFLTMMFRAGDDYENHAAVKAKNPANLKLKLYEQATMTIADDICEIRRWISRNQPCTVPSKFGGSSSKRPRVTLALPPQETSVSFSNLKKKDTITKPSQMPWGSGWGNDAPVVKRKGPSPEESKKRGDLICRPGRQDGALQPDLAKEYCTPFQVLGQYCSDVGGCTKKHIGIYRWKPADRIKQIEYVEKHKENVMFNEESVRFLHAGKKHLLRNPAGKN